MTLKLACAIDGTAGVRGRLERLFVVPDRASRGVFLPTAEILGMFEMLGVSARLVRLLLAAGEVRVVRVRSKERAVRREWVVRREAAVCGRRGRGDRGGSESGEPYGDVRVVGDSAGCCRMLRLVKPASTGEERDSEVMVLELARYGEQLLAKKINKIDMVSSLKGNE